MEIREARNLAISLMQQHGLSLTNWSFRFDNSKRRAGLCRWFGSKKDRTCTGGVISLSKHFVALNEPHQIRETLLHEIAHALVPWNGHDSVWVAKARSIGSLGVRCYSHPDREETHGKVVMPERTLKPAWKAVCASCGKECFRSRALPKGYRSSCGNCSPGKFNPAFQLEYVWNR